MFEIGTVSPLVLSLAVDVHARGVVYVIVSNAHARNAPLPAPQSFVVALYANVSDRLSHPAATTSDINTTIDTHIFVGQV